MSSNRKQILAGSLMLLLALLTAPGLLAGDWRAGLQETLATGGGSGMTGVVVLEQGGIQVIDGITQTLSPVLLQRELGYDVPVLLRPRSSLLDVAITPNASTALISSPYTHRVYFVSLLNPRAPVVLGSASAGWYPEDIAVTGDGKWALVTSGGRRDIESQLSVLNVATRRVVTSQRLGDAYLAAVAVSPDGKTVLCADPYHGELLVLRMNPATGALTYVKAIALDDYYAPINIAISPDGRTALTANTEMGSLLAETPEGGAKLDIPRPEAHLSVFRIDGPGQVLFTGNIALGERHQSVQAVAFSRTGTRAFCVASRHEEAAKTAEKLCFDPDPPAEVEVDVLAVTGPGLVLSTGTSIPLPLSEYYRWTQGMDTLAVDPLDRYLYVTVQNDYIDDRIDLYPYVAVISLRTYQIIDVIESPMIPYDKGYRYFIPMGIAFRENSRPLTLHLP